MSDKGKNYLTVYKKGYTINLCTKQEQKGGMLNVGHNENRFRKNLERVHQGLSAYDEGHGNYNQFNVEGIRRHSDQR